MTNEELSDLSEEISQLRTLICVDLGTATAAPRERSDAEIVAEGKTCAQQWRSAARETASDGSQDVQLRGTLYACETT
jgi:hypothetical protein